MNLTVVNATDDKARRGRVAIVIGVSVLVSLILARQSAIGGVPGSLLALAVLTGAGIFAWQGGMFARAHAMLRLGAIRREGLEATRKLNAGDLQGAREAFAALLVKAQPLGAFHAMHVLMYGVTRFCEGHTKEGLELSARALGSGWFKGRGAVREAAETWRALMLLEDGDVAQARQLVEAAPKAMVTPSVLLALHDKDWAAAASRARAALADPEFPPSGRSTVAALGRFAAKKGKEDASVFETELEKSPLGELAKKNPALARFVR